MDWAEAETAANDTITLFVAFNYGGRAEILDAAARFDGGGEDAFRALLYAPEMHDPDLIIRTSGEQRMSNYLLWQSAYSELVLPRRAVAGLHRARRSRPRSTSTPGAGAGSGAADGRGPRRPSARAERPPPLAAAAAAQRRGRPRARGSSSRSRRSRSRA